MDSASPGPIELSLQNAGAIASGTSLMLALADFNDTGTGRAATEPVLYLSDEAWARLLLQDGHLAQALPQVTRTTLAPGASHVIAFSLDMNSAPALYDISAPSGLLRPFTWAEASPFFLNCDDLDDAAALGPGGIFATPYQKQAWSAFAALYDEVRLLAGGGGGGGGGAATGGGGALAAASGAAPAAAPPASAPPAAAAPASTPR